VPEHKPQLPGNVRVHLEPGSGSIQIDDYDIGQFVTSMKLLFDAERRRPVLLLDLLPSAVDVTGAVAELRGDFRDFLVSHGWQPPQ
jgi:hypothetical protein